MGGNADQNIVIWQYALNASWVLLPLVPAVLIYLIFPRTQTSLGGPFAGLTIRSSGAFAAYFIVLLSTYPLLDRQNRNIEGLLRPSWIVTGSVQIEDEEGREIDYESQGQSPLEITLRPDLVTLMDQKTFRVTVPEIDNRVPAIFVRYRGYGTKAVDPAKPAEGLNVQIDQTKRLIEITSPLVIRRKPCVGTSCEPQP